MDRIAHKHRNIRIAKINGKDERQCIGNKRTLLETNTKAPKI